MYTVYTSKKKIICTHKVQRYRYWEDRTFDTAKDVFYCAKNEFTTDEKA